MKTVTIFRHAKSGEKNNPNIEDFERPLSDRGLKAAPKMGAAMRDRKLRPDLILSSPSVRTRQTLALAAPEAWDNPPKVRYLKKLYDASAESLLQLIRRLPEDVRHVMIVGHNPGLQELAALLSPPSSSARRAFNEKLPTAAVASFDFDTERWSNLQPETGHLRFAISPNSLRR
jgi:phosphohistidine phosphatase